MIGQRTGAYTTLPTRIVSIDVMRAVSMLYIVGFWHLLDYTDVRQWHHNSATYRLTVTALSLFVLISGFLAGRKDGALVAGDFWKFYKTRLWRIYFPFVIAASLFLVSGLDDIVSLIKGVALVAMLLAPPPFTLWFVSMIILFYMVAPLLISLRSYGVIYLGVCSAIILAMILYQAETSRMDMRLLIYFPCFAAGIFLAGGTLPSSRVTLIRLQLLAVMSLVPTFARSSAGLETDPWAAPWAFFGSIAFFTVVMYVGRNLRVHAIVIALSEASYFMYLLHRPIYLWMRTIWFPSNEKEQIFYLLFVCLPIIGIVAWLGQRAYMSLFQSDKFRVAAASA